MVRPFVGSIGTPQTIPKGCAQPPPRWLKARTPQFGEASFSEDLAARRMAAAAALLLEQPSIAVADVARLVGYRQAPHFARAFRGRYGLSPARFRERASAREPLGTTSSAGPGPRAV